MKRIFLISSLILLSLSLCFSQNKMPDKAKIKHINNDFSINELDNNAWKKAKSVKVAKYWSGKNAPKGKQFETKFLWSDSAIYVRFEANQDEPLVISDAPNLETKTRGLWDRDVCEIFLAPKKDDFRHYFEFEIAPNGEWIDLGIYQKPDERITDWNYNSGMNSAARIGKDQVIMAIKIEWKAFGAIPKIGDVWLGNILRAMGSEPNRSYLTWSPTMTKEPNFHVPEKFGEFEFIK